MDIEPQGASTTPNVTGGTAAGPGGLRRAVVVAGHNGNAAIARAHLHHDDPAVRAAALAALERAGDLAAADLVEAAGDPDPAVRRRVAEMAALPGTVEPDTPDTGPRHNVLEAVLMELLADDHDVVVEVAAFALGELPFTDGATAGKPARVGALAEVATGHDDALCRESAVAALGAIGHPGGLPAVLAGCADRASVRRRAVLALAAFEGEHVTATLEHLCADRDLQVSQAAVDLLGIETGEDL